MYKVALFGLLLIFQACGKSSPSERTDSRQAPSSQPTQPLERLDPYSNPLYPARTENRAKDFTVPLIDGTPFQLSRQKGKVVLINIWATWCPPCREETPELVALYNEYKDDGLVIIGVSIDEQRESVVRPFMKEFAIPYPIYIDKDEIVMDKYGPVMGIPTTYVVDKEGMIRYFATGALTRKELEPRIQVLLEEKADP